MKTKEELIQAISGVKHPAIDYSLWDLGIVKDIIPSEDEVTVIFAFPFPNIPIATQLVNSIAQVIIEMGFVFKYQIIVMTELEKEKFLRMEHEAWTGSAPSNN